MTATTRPTAPPDTPPPAPTPPQATPQDATPPDPGYPGAASLEPASPDRASLDPAPLTPAPPDPASLDPASPDRASLEPASLEPASLTPAPPDPASLDPASLEPAPPDRASLDPAPLTPAPLDALSPDPAPLTPAPPDPAPPGTGRHGERPDAYLWRRLRLVEERVRRAVADRRAGDPDPDDPYRGQYLTPDAADRLLAAPAGGGALAPQAEEPPPGTVLGDLARDFGLAPLDVELLLVALAPDLDARFERLYGYLNDDLTRRRPTVGLALELCGHTGTSGGRFRLAPGAPLLAGGLLVVADPERPPLSRVVAVPDRVTAHLLGDPAPDARLVPVLGEDAGAAGDTADPAHDAAQVARAAAAADSGTGHVHLRARGGAPESLAGAALRASGRRPLVLDAAALARRAAELPALAAAAAREARLTGAGLVLGPLEALPDNPADRAHALRVLTGALSGLPLFTFGADGWDPGWAARTPVVLTVTGAPAERQAVRWRYALAAAGAAAPAADVEALARSVAAHRLDSGQLRRAAEAAVRTATLAGRPVAPGDLRAAVRAQNSAGLARLARRVEPAVGWDDLVLPPRTRRGLRELAVRARHRDRVLGQWGMRPGGGRGRGVIALFAGESGTGKTMSAEVVAADLGMDLYVVDLSTVVDKYIGETEKNLERIFTEASAVNAVLLFDEADAIFGKRSEVKDSRDKHANIESAYLLQRMESFDGIAVLTTNLRANLDEAFTRRLDVVADFPVPDAAQRLALWERCVGARLPRADDLDLAFCADRFELAGGSIRSCAVTAAYLAAESAAPLTMAQLVSAVAQEYRKLGRLVLESEFGPWLAQVTGV
ncbi:AAA family ATPase [Streptomyces sp. NPDC049813]|uniref:AAA family ATPase n=1 Tax=Streptomyces sp. NPDC049813 TaxID=3365597 RepID=UPI003797A836